MGLFISNIHVRDVAQSAVVDALSLILETSGFKAQRKFTPSGPCWPEKEALGYLISPMQGRWVTLIQAHGWVQDGVRTYEVARKLSLLRKTYALTFHLHDGDVLYYNLLNQGRDLDGYNSMPNYFETKPLSELDIEGQRHDCAGFLELLPEGRNTGDLAEILNRGWWSAHDGKRLDEDGLQGEEDWTDEEDRLIQMGNLLQLHGEPAGFPYASWASEVGAKIPWAAFVGMEARAEGQVPG